MRKLFNNAKAILTLFAVLTIPAVLSAATSFASVSAIENPSTVNKTETLIASEQEDSLIDSEQLCVNNFYGRTRLKELLHNQNKVILTFDDGPSPNTTPYVLDALRARNIKAIFFVLGLQANKHPELVKRIHEEGHIVGNHTYHHKNLAKMTKAQVKKEIDMCSDLIEKITGERPRYFRPPFGAIGKTVTAAATEAGVNVVLWTVDTRDWKSRNEHAVLKEVDKQLGISSNHKHGGAILMHDIYGSTVRSLGPVLDKLAANEIKVASIDKLANTASDFWAVKAPVVFTSPIGRRHINPELSGNPLMIAMLTEKPKARPSSAAMLRASREGSLFLYLAKHNL